MTEGAQQLNSLTGAGSGTNSVTVNPIFHTAVVLHLGEVLHGNIGAEGSEIAIANLVVAIQQAQRAGGGGGKEYNYRDSLSGTSAMSDGKCMWMNVPGSGSVMSGC